MQGSTRPFRRKQPGTVPRPGYGQVELGLGLGRQDDVVRPERTDKAFRSTRKAGVAQRFAGGFQGGQVRHAVAALRCDVDGGPDLVAAEIKPGRDIVDPGRGQSGLPQDVRQHVGMGLHAAHGHWPVPVNDDKGARLKRAVVHQAQYQLRRIAAQIGQQGGGGARHLEMIAEQGHKAGGTRINLDKRGQRQQVLFAGRKPKQSRHPRQTGKKGSGRFGPRPRRCDDPGRNINQGASRSFLGRGVPSMAQDPGREPCAFRRDQV